ncbi:MAG: hypothetical protein L6R39_001186 [Caloplaca ligustica]|nr:MAG: hypothetical protein L6R39_001186 [Caloplaca ligustica]
MSTSHVSITTNKGISGALFGVAILTYGARCYIRTFVVKQFLVDDALLLFAVICLCVTTGLDLDNVQSLYDSLAVILHGPDMNLLLKTLDQIPRISRHNNAAATLWWCVIYPVKLAFLFFFRRLIVRLPKLYVWWWWVLGITVLSWIGATVADWLTCPFTAVEKVLCM